jgi:hypothetical protein
MNRDKDIFSSKHQRDKAKPDNIVGLYQNVGSIPDLKTLEVIWSQGV